MTKTNHMISQLSTPWLYVFVHICIGAVSVYYPLVWIPVIVYQFGQYVFNVRIFVFSLEICEGNTLFYTFCKLLQYCIGAASVQSIQYGTVGAK